MGPSAPGAHAVRAMGAAGRGAPARELQVRRHGAIGARSAGRPRWRRSGAMIRRSVFSPKTEGATFDHDYSRDSHVPLASRTWGADAQIDKGLDGPYEAAVHFTFDSLDALGAAMGNEG